MKIIVIDDEMIDLFVSKRILGVEFQVEGFNKLSDAINWAKDNSFDVLLSDYYLGNGVSAQDVLKALIDIRGKTFKSFVITNYIDDKKKSEIKQAGFDGTIDKPLELAKFKSLLA
jgi:DNA-binding NtrC family response regulator